MRIIAWKKSINNSMVAEKFTFIRGDMLRMLVFLVFSMTGLAWADRPVHIVSIAFTPTLSTYEVIELVSNEAKKGCDLIILPETFRGYKPESIYDETIEALSQLAAAYKTYILCPIDRLNGGHRFNSAILLDRKGLVFEPIYDKKFPFWTEYDLEPPIEPGSSHPAVYDLDFGRIGVCICFDLNFPSLWKTFANEKVDMVVWPSAYSGGSLLRSYALQYHFYIVTCTQIPDCSVIDIDGSEILFERNGNPSISHVELDFDRCIFHYDFNEEITNKLADLLRDHGQDIFLERRLEREKWFILKAKNHSISARQLAKAYGLEELSPYISRSEEYVVLPPQRRPL